MSTGKALYKWDQSRDWVFLDIHEEWMQEGLGRLGLEEAVYLIDAPEVEESFHAWVPQSAEGESFSFRLPEGFFR